MLGILGSMTEYPQPVERLHNLDFGNLGSHEADFGFGLAILGLGFNASGLGRGLLERANWQQQKDHGRIIYKTFLPMVGTWELQKMRDRSLQVNNDVRTLERLKNLHIHPATHLSLTKFNISRHSGSPNTNTVSLYSAET